MIDFMINFLKKHT